MTLVPGARLGPYEVVGVLGAGGMGEVYRARDTRLGRTVAIKVLPDGAGEAPGAREDRRRRFDQEARLVSALNHPHICALYDIGSENGSEYLVMECLEGHTLADRLTRKGRLPLDEALEVAIQVADALAAAHRAGIVHGDLKPDNVMLTRTGAKLLDFGIARLTAAAGGAPGTAPIPGTVVGTLPYVAPEQLRGAPADARTDLFAFGALLYEMLTGTRAFEGETPAVVIAAILDVEPRTASAVQPLIPPGVDRVVSRCLAKNPEARWQTATDLGAELRWLRGGSVGAGAAEGGVRRNRWPSAILGLGAVCCVVVGAMIVRTLTPTAAMPDVVRSTIRLPSTGTLGSSPGLPRLAISPNGRRLVYVSQEGASTALFVRDLDGGIPAKLPGSDGGQRPFYSPDGAWIGFWTADGQIKKLPSAGGTPIPVAAAPDLRSVAWGDDDWIVFPAGICTGLSRVKATGGTVEVLTTADRAAGEKTHRHPDVLPGSRAVLYTVGSAELASYSDARIVVRDLTSGQTHTLVEGGMNAHYVAPGFLVYAKSGSLWAVAFDPNALTVSGRAVEIQSGVSTASAYGTSDFAVSRTGTLVYAAGQDAVITRRIVRVDRQGKPEPVLEDTGGVFWAVPSPDGRHVLFSDVAANESLWSYDTSRGTTTRLTRGWDAAFPAWSEDQQRVFVASDRERPYLRLFSVPATGGALELLLDQPVFALDVQARGDLLAFQAPGAGTRDDIWLFSVAGGRARPWLNSQYNEGSPALSPDGRLMAFSSDSSGQFEVYVAPIDEPGRPVQFSSGGGTQPRWHPNGRELFFAEGARVVSVAVSLSGADPRPGKPVLLFDGSAYVRPWTTGAAYFTVAADGNHFVTMERPPADAPVTELCLVTNWVTELTRRLAVK